MKSHVRDLIELAVNVYQDSTAMCATTPDKRDLDTLRKRIEKEGVSFLTLTLPTLGSDLEKALSEGSIGPTHFRSFKKRGKAPAFLQGFFAQVFDSGTGGLLHDKSIDSIRCIRQIAYAFKKIRIACSPNKERQAITKFMECEHDLLEPCASVDVENFKQVSRHLWSQVLPSISLVSMRPKHGPGATAERIHGNMKYVPRRWHDRLEPYFPLLTNAFHNENAYESSEFENVTIISEEQEQPVRVVTVPKTLKGPRIIAIEPVCMQYTQQAVSRELTSALERHWLTRGHVNFSDQTINQNLAMKASIDQSLATLDLSAASDRVPVDLALCMFDSNPDLRDAIYACRSRRAQHDRFGVIELRKFASMGSALCFPVEAMYFYTICVMALLKERNLPVNMLTIKAVSRDVYVYGDDIIVPTHEVASVVDHLHKYHCKVNTDKSFWNGNFRESCGLDAFDGVDVTPTYVRELCPLNRQSVKALISWVETSNLLYKKGYWLSSQYMLSKVENILGKLPVVGDECSGLGKVSYQKVGLTDKVRWNKNTHEIEVRTWVPTVVRKADALSGYSALVKCLLKLEERACSSFDECMFRQPKQDRPKSGKGVMSPISGNEFHLDETELRGAVTLRRRWTCPGF